VDVAGVDEAARCRNASKSVNEQYHGLLWWSASTVDDHVEKDDVEEVDEWVDEWDGCVVCEEDRVEEGTST
jgi:hypothetical protein